MNKKIIMKTTVILSTLLLAACGTVPSVDNSQAEAQSQISYEGVSKKSDSRIDGKIQNYKYFNGRIYFLSSTAEYDNMTYCIGSVNIDGSDFKSKSTDSSIIGGFDFNSNGEIVLAETIYSSSGETYKLRTTDENGETISEIDITSAVSANMNGFYPDDLCIDKSGNIIIISYDGVIVFDSTGNYIFSERMNESDMISSLVTDGDGNVYINLMLGETYTHALWLIDTQNKTVSPAAAFDFLRTNYTEVFAGNGNADIYINDGTSLYSYDIASGTDEQILEWVNSGISLMDVSNMFTDESGKLICVGQNSTTDEIIITKIEPKSSSDESQKQILTLAGTQYGISTFLEQQVIDFNRTSDEYKIILKKYYDDELNKFTADMLSGKMPDILITSSSDDIPTDNYNNKGLFEDLYPYIDSDDQLRREDFLPNILSVCETNGKLYNITDSFSLLTALGKKSIFGDKMGITFDELDKIKSKYPESTDIFAGSTKNDIMQYAMKMSENDFIDYKTGKCNYQTDSFYKLLRFSNRFMSQEQADKYFEDGTFVDNSLHLYAEDEALLLTAYIRSFSDFFLYERQIFGEDVTAVGFPSETAIGTAFTPESSLAISASSENKNAAWEFLRNTLLPDYQDNVELFPIRQDSLDKRSEDALNIKPNNSCFLLYNIGNNSIGIGGEFNDHTKPTQADVDDVMKIITSTEADVSTNANVEEIISDEVQLYFDGNKNEEDTAQAIQSRVQLYLDENS